MTNCRPNLGIATKDPVTLWSISAVRGGGVGTLTQAVSLLQGDGSVGSAPGVGSRGGGNFPVLRIVPGLQLNPNCPPGTRPVLVFLKDKLGGPCA